MFIANTTQQVATFLYRSLETNQLRGPYEIDIGSQIRLRNLQPEQITAIAEHHAVYGMVRVNEVPRAKPYIGLCWDDKPISIDKIATAIDHNSEVLNKMGAQIRQETAVHINNVVKDASPQDYRSNLNLQLTEKPRKNTDASFAENIHVGLDVNPDGTMNNETAPKRKRR